MRGSHNNEGDLVVINGIRSAYSDTKESREEIPFHKGYGGLSSVIKVIFEGFSNLL